MGFRTCLCYALLCAAATHTVIPWRRTRMKHHTSGCRVGIVKPSCLMLLAVLESVLRPTSPRNFRDKLVIGASMTVSRWQQPHKGGHVTGRRNPFTHPNTITQACSEAEAHPPPTLKLVTGNSGGGSQLIFSATGWRNVYVPGTMGMLATMHLCCKSWRLRDQILRCRHRIN